MSDISPALLLTPLNHHPSHSMFVSASVCPSVRVSAPNRHLFIDAEAVTFTLKTEPQNEQRGLLGFCLTVFCFTPIEKQYM